MKNKKIILTILLFIIVATCCYYGGYMLGSKLNANKTLNGRVRKANNKTDKEISNNNDNTNNLNESSIINDISENDAKNLEQYFSLIDPLENYNSNYEYALDEATEIDLSTIDEKMLNYFGAKINYLNEFWHMFEHFELQEDKYVGKSIVGGMEPEDEYRYFYDNYSVLNDTLTINVLAGYYSVGIGVYDRKDSDNLVCGEECAGGYTEDISLYKDKLTNLEYIFKIDGNNYRFQEIKVK